MHAIKGGWTGRPLALAKNNEAEGRRTRIRRSKEERKAMVEVFIKKESNNGSFPSLNLTHKEVGGSFYTVREIVRDIIQENRILGPGNLLLEEHNTDHSLEQNPLHSIAIEPQSPLTLSSNEVHFPVNYNKYINEEPIFVSDEQCTATNIQGSQNESIINGSLVDVSNEASDEFIQSELLVNEHKEVEEMVEKESGMPKNHVTPLATDVVLVNEHNEVEEVVKEESGMPINYVTPLATDVVVETFPLDSVPWDVNGSDVRSEILISTSASEKQVSQSIELESDVGLFNITTSDCVVEKAEENLTEPLTKTKFDLVEEAQIVEISNGSTVKEGSIHYVGGPELEVCSDTPVSVNFEQGQKSSKMKSPIASENLNKTFSNDFDQASKIEIENKVDPGQTGGSQKESVPTLNRINLDSWEGMSKNSSKPKNNPLLEIIKSFITAFVKFWSE